MLFYAGTFQGNMWKLFLGRPGCGYGIALEIPIFKWMHLSRNTLGLACPGRIWNDIPSRSQIRFYSSSDRAARDHHGC